MSGANGGNQAGPSLRGPGCLPEGAERMNRGAQRRNRSGGRSGTQAENRSGFTGGEERAGDESAEGRSPGTLRSERLPLLFTTQTKTPTPLSGIRVCI